MDPDTLKSIAIAQAVAACINAEGGVGPFAGEAAKAVGNSVRIHSQVCDDIFIFHGDGTVDLMDPEKSYNNIASEFNEDEVEDTIGTLEEFIKDNTHIPFETFMSVEHGWFCGNDVEDACIKFVKAIIANE